MALEHGSYTPHNQLESDFIAQQTDREATFPEIPPLFNDSVQHQSGAKPVFDPEAELKELREQTRLRKNEKRIPIEVHEHAIQQYTARLIEQREDIAELQSEIVRMIRQNPDINQFELYRFCQERAEALGLSPKQRTALNWAVGDYIARHALVNKYRTENPDDAQLFETIFKRPPIGKVQVVTDPMTLYFRCFHPEDYIYVYSYQWLTGIEPTEDQLEKALNSGAVSLGALSGIILAENSNGVGYDYGPMSQSNQEHEEQHAFARLLEQTSRKVDTYDRQYIVYLKLLKTESDTELARLITEYFRLIRMQRIDMRAQDELLAYFSGGEVGEEVVSRLLQPDHLGGLYDYEVQNLDELTDQISRIINHLGADKSQMVYKAYKAAIQDEYQQLLRQGTQAIMDLASMQYSKAEILGLLMHEPLSRWRKIVDRVGEELAKSIRG